MRRKSFLELVWFKKIFILYIPKEFNMYLHAGNKKNIRNKNIIGIFDTDNCTVSMISRKFLSEAQKRSEMESAVEEIPKSFILFEHPNRDLKRKVKTRSKDDEVKERIRKKKKRPDTRVCFSQISSSALVGRIVDGWYGSYK